MNTTGVSTGPAPALAPAPTGDPSAFQGMSTDDFLKLLITELQNQDPVSPMESDEILNQVGQLQSIESNKKLTETLDAVLLGQNAATASGLIGKRINGLDDEGEEVSGQVTKVSLADGEASLRVGASTVKLKNVREVLP
jgi:flagellar basal-body rod modification protein FlgD